MMINDLRTQYVAFFGLEPVEAGVLQELERSLNVTIPGDFKEIASFYSGGILGGISHHAIAASGRASNILEETSRLRVKAKLPKSMIVLAEPPESLIVMDSNAQEGSPVVMWIDINELSRLGTPMTLSSPQVWPTYADFFAFLLRREKEERAYVALPRSREGIRQFRGDEVAI